MKDPDAPSSLDRALRALAARHDSPQQAFDLASDLIASQTQTDEATVVATWALGHAAREMNDLAAAEVHLLHASALATKLGLKWRSAQIQSSLVGVLIARGRADEALRTASGIRHLGSDAERAELDMRRATALQEIGQIDAAIDAYTLALPAIRAGDDRLVEIRLLSNRGNALAYQGRTSEAITDSLEAENLALKVGQTFLAGCAAHNAGFVYGRDGNLVSALAAFDRADALYDAVDYPGRCDGVLAADRCEVLLIAGLIDEALASANHAVGVLEDVADVGDLAEARLLQARAHLASGDHDQALTIATAARSEFNAADRPGWAALASHVVLRSTLLAEDGDRSNDGTSLESVERVAQELEGFGWPAEAVSVRISAAQLAIRSGNTGLAERHLQQSVRARRHGRPDRRANAWLATAMLRHVNGNDIGAARAVDAGLRTILEYQASLGATELRVGATVHANELGRLGVELAIDSGKPRRILAAAERLRATALGRTLPGPAAHEHLRVERSLLRELQTAERTTGPDESLRTEIRQQEHRLQNLARQVRGSGGSRSTFDLEVLIDALGDRQLVEFVEHRGAIGAVTMTAGRCRYRELTDLKSIDGIIETAQFSLQRAGRQRLSAASAAAAIQSLEECAEALDRILFQPLHLTSERVVVIPSGALQNVAWAGLPSLRHRDFSITPGAQRWSQREVRSLNVSEVRVIVGPDLPFGGAELDAVSRRYSTAQRLTGERATVSETLALLDQAGVAHVACHGAFRSDSPMFSSLRMFDGALNVYDLEELRSPPELVVLPACDAATTGARNGEQLLGTSSALLGIGVRSVIAPMAPINDEASVGVMDRFHEVLVSGATPSQALLASREQAFEHGDHATVAVATALVCME